MLTQEHAQTARDFLTVADADFDFTRDIVRDFVARMLNLIDASPVTEGSPE